MTVAFKDEEGSSHWKEGIPAPKNFVAVIEPFESREPETSSKQSGCVRVGAISKMFGEDCILKTKFIFNAPAT